MPLRRYELFRAERPRDLERLIETELNGRFAASLKADHGLSARADFYRLPSSELWFCDYGVPLRLAFDASDYIRVQLRYAGIGATSVGGDRVAVTDKQACISSGATVIDFTPGYRQLVWRVSRDLLAKKFAALTGLPLPHTLQFSPTVDLRKAQTGSFLRILRVLLETIDDPAPRVTPLILAELEQALVVALLCGCQHNCQGLLDQASGAAAPWQVRRAEEYIEENWDRPVGIEEIAAATGASVRTIYRTFRESRGYSPNEFAKSQRLTQARKMLMEGGSSTSVTAVSLACGFADLGHFSREFSRAFGEPPSAMLRRRS